MLKTSDLEWKYEHTKAFEEIKWLLMNYTTLGLPRKGEPLFLHTDASCYAVGGVLQQQADPPKKYADHVPVGEMKGLIQQYYKETAAIGDAGSQQMLFSNEPDSVTLQVVSLDEKPKTPELACLWSKAPEAKAKFHEARKLGLRPGDALLVETEHCGPVVLMVLNERHFEAASFISSSISLSCRLAVGQSNTQSTRVTILT